MSGAVHVIQAQRRNPWRKVKIESSIIDKSDDVQYMPYEVLNRRSTMTHELLQSCERNPNCNSVCEISDTQFSISPGLISPFYQRFDDSEDSYTCYSQQGKDLVFGKDIDSSANVGGLVMIPRNLAQGYWNGDMGNCGELIHNTEAKWITVDFGKVERFQTIKLTSSFHSLSDYFVKKGEIYVGNETLTNGDFSAYKFLDSYPDNTVRGATMTIHLKTPAYGRYLGLLQTSTNHVFVLCYLQVN